MDDFLLTLGALTLGGSAAILLLSLASRSTRSLYGARWRCWAWLLLCLRLAVPFPLLPQGQREAAPIQLPTFSDSIIYQSRPGGGEQSPPEGQSGEAPGKAGSQGSTVSSSYSGGQPDPSWDEPFSLSLSQLAGALWLVGVTVVVLWAGLATCASCATSDAGPLLSWTATLCVFSTS